MHGIEPTTRPFKALGHGRFRQQVEAEWNTLLQAALAAPPTPPPADAYGQLPPAVRRHLEQCGIGSTAIAQLPAAVSLGMQGQLRLGPRGRWMPTLAQHLASASPTAPGFVWNARSQLVPGVNMWVRDRWTPQQGGDMWARLGRVATVIHENGPEIGRSAFVRYLTETALTPGLWLAPCMQWQDDGPHEATATLTVGQHVASATFCFHPQTGDLTKVWAMRPYNADKLGQDRPFEAHLSSYRSFGLLRMASQVDIRWVLPDMGAFSWYRFTVPWAVGHPGLQVG